MKRFVLFSLLSLLLNNSLMAASGGPDRFGYTWKDSNEPGGPVYSWWDITTTGTLVNGLTDDNVAGPFPMIQGFQYFWYEPQSFWIGSNGYIGFEGGVLIEPFNFHINWIKGTKDYIAPFLTDLNFAGLSNSGRCFMRLQGDSLCVSWENVPFWAPTGFSGSNSFQVILNRANHSITLNYKQVSSSSSGAIAAITNKSGTLGFRMIENQPIPSNYTIRIERPFTSTLQFPDVAINHVGNEAGKGEFLNRAGAARKFRARVSNQGNTSAQNLSVVGAVGAQSLGTVTIPALAAGRDTLIEFPQSWTGTQTGVQNLSAEIQGMAVDSFLFNNGAKSKIVVVDSSRGKVNLAYHQPATNYRAFTFVNNNTQPIAFGSYFKPSFYPAKVRAASFQTITIPTGGFCLKIYDDNGPGGQAGTLLDSVYLQASNMRANANNLIPVGKQDLVLTSGGVYVMMEFYSNTIPLVCDTSYPSSFRQYQLFAGVWGEFVHSKWCELAIGLQVEGLPQQDLTPRQVVNPVPGWMPINNAPVRVWVRNRGLAAASGFQIGYRAGNAAPVVAPYNGGSIQPGDSVLFTFPQPFQTSGLFPDDEFCVWTQLAADSLSDNDTVCFFLQTGVAAQSLERSEIKLFPNPARSGQALTIQLPESQRSGQWELTVLDVSGRLVFRQSSSIFSSQAEKTQLELPSLVTGLYQVVFRRNEEVFRQSLVITAQ